MDVTILCENVSSDVGCLAEWGFSVLLEINGRKILFDTGYSDVYLHNAKQRNIDLESIDAIVLSHFHNDHTGGLRFHTYQSKKRLICHPEVLEKLPSDEAASIRKHFEITTSVEPVEVLPDMVYLGEIPRVTSFEKGEIKGDKMRDDSALAIKMAEGVVVISGCSHAGICNICEYAKQVTGLPLHAVIGGFHLFESDQEAVAGTIDYLQQESPKHLYPMHCVDFPTLAKFHHHFGTKKYSAGEVIHI